MKPSPVLGAIRRAARPVTASIGRFSVLCALAALGTHGTVVAPVQAQDAQARGKALYENRCLGCHGRSVHDRPKRVAASVADIRFNVVRWDRELGALWNDEEITAVTRYLNATYYHFPCPENVCGSERAGLAAALASAGRSRRSADRAPR